jgi:peptidyl-prolyl cis-trans isomerase D
MLTLFRDLVRSKVALVIIGLLILSLALFGVPDFFGSLFNQNLGTSIMRADSRRLEAADIDRFANNIIQNDRRNAEAEAAQTGAEPRATLTKIDLAESGQLSQIINLLSDMEIRGAYIDKLGIGASKQELADWIRNVEGLQNPVTSGFDRDQYAQFVQQRGFNSESQFEDALMTELSFDNVRAGLDAALQPPAGMSDLWSVFQSESRNIAYFTFSLSDLPEAIERPSDEEILTFYNERQDLLMEPERRQFSVIAITPEDFIHKVTVSAEDVRNEYEAQIFKYSGPATRTYSMLYFENSEAAQKALGELGAGEPLESVGGVLVEGLSAVENQYGRA